MKERTRKILGDVAIVELILVLLFLVLLNVVKPTESATMEGLATLLVILEIDFGILAYFVLDHLYDTEEKEKEKEKQEKKQRQKESKKFVKDNIPIGKWTQVVPKEKNDDFLFEIIDIADIYAYREDGSSAVEIYLDFHFEEKKRFYERVKKRYFTEFYEIK